MATITPESLAKVGIANPNALSSSIKETAKEDAINELKQVLANTKKNLSGQVLSDEEFQALRDRLTNQPLPGIQSQREEMDNMKALRDKLSKSYLAQTDISPLMALSDTWYGGNLAQSYKAPKTAAQQIQAEMAATNMINDAAKEQAQQEIAFGKEMITPPTMINQISQTDTLDKILKKLTEKETEQKAAVVPQKVAAGPNIDKQVVAFSKDLDKIGAPTLFESFAILDRVVPNGIGGYSGGDIPGIGKKEAFKHNIVTQTGNDLLSTILPGVAKENDQGFRDATSVRSALAGIVTAIRKGFFGSALTQTEKAAFEKMASNPDLYSPEQIMDQVRMLSSRAKASLKNIEAGYGGTSGNVVKTYRNNFGEGAVSSDAGFFQTQAPKKATKSSKPSWAL